MKNTIALVVHGGSGTILKNNLIADAERGYRTALEEALKKGYDILQIGGTAVDAVEVAVKMMEDNPLFNAGRGSVFTSDGRNELDAAIMEGKTLRAGAVAEISNVKNPVSAARAVMEKSEHVMLVGRGAEQFAEQCGLEIVDSSYFFTQERWNALIRVREEDPSKTELDHGNPLAAAKKSGEEKFGTVGAVALDMNGALAAATSTGGMTNKKFGRVGDSPLIGAGNYANAICAVSCTGWGEYFIRVCAAKTLCDLVEYKGLTLQKASMEVIRQVSRLGGDGGLIAVDAEGNIAMPFSTEGMYRGYVKKDGKVRVGIFKEKLSTLR